MKSLRNIGLAVVLSLGASQMNAGVPVKPVAQLVQAPVVQQLVTAPAVAKTGFGESVKSVWGKVFNQENWTSCKNVVSTGFNASVDFCKKHGKKGLELVKNNKKTSIVVASVIAAGLVAGAVYKYRKSIAGLFGKVKLGKRSEIAKNQGGNVESRIMIPVLAKNAQYHSRSKN